MIVIMLGAPGSGKGTISKLLSSDFEIEHISTGDMFREESASGSELGKELQSYMSKGELVPDETVIRILESRLDRKEAENGVVLDGFPRTIAQAKALKEMLAKKGKKVDMALQLNISDEDIIYRTTKRISCSNKECGAIYNLEFKKTKTEGICDVCGSELVQRKDDNEDTIRNRLEVYHKNTESLIQYFADEGILYTVDLRADKNVTKEEVRKWVEDYNK